MGAGVIVGVGTKVSAALAGRPFVSVYKIKAILTQHFSF